MTIKKDYKIGDTVWIHGVSKENKLTKGTIVKSFNIDYWGQSLSTYYVVAVSTHIEPLLEIRTWETISEDSVGPIGGFRNLKDLDSIHKLIGQSGYQYENDENDDPSEEQIQAAISKSISNQSHQPLILKDIKTKPRKRFTRRKTRE
jgi:hypothetical protein